MGNTASSMYCKYCTRSQLRLHLRDWPVRCNVLPNKSRRREKEGRPTHSSRERGGGEGMATEVDGSEAGSPERGERLGRRSERKD